MPSPARLASERVRSSECRLTNVLISKGEGVARSWRRVRVAEGVTHHSKVVGEIKVRAEFGRGRRKVGKGAPEGRAVRAQNHPAGQQN